MKKQLAALLAASGLVLGIPGVASADNVRNNVEADGNGTITAGGSTTITYRIQETNNDGQKNCNASDSTPAVLTISAPTGVTANPTSLTFTACGHDGAKSASFTSSSVGSHNITHSVADAGTGTYDVSHANWTLTVNAPANTAPTLSLPANIDVPGNTLGGATVNYTATASDTQDGALTPTCTPDSGSLFPVGVTTVNCSVTDSGGLSASGSFTVTVRNTAPTLSLPANIDVPGNTLGGATVNYTATASDIEDGPLALTCSPAPGTVFPVGTTTVNCSATDSKNATTSGSFTVTVRNTAPSVSVAGVTSTSYNKGSEPAATCNVTDTEDGNSSHAASLSAVTGTYASDGIGSQTASCSHTDSGGLTATPASVTYSIVDPTAPVIGKTVNPTTPDGLNGWYKSNVSLTWSVSEPESPNSLAKDGCVNQNITADQVATDYSCSATSAGGSAQQQTVTIKRDSSAPEAPTFNGGPVNGATYYLDDAIPGAPTCSAVDVGPSGIASCTTSGHSTAFGTHTISGTATDNAGNRTTGNGATYTIAPWTSFGYYSPVRMGTDVMNSVKGGSTVPLKFELFKGTTEITSTTGITYQVQKYGCDPNDTAVTDLALETTGSTQLRYDTTDGQFIQNWKTPTTKGCYRAIVTPPHGAAPLVAQFQVR